MPYEKPDAVPRNPRTIAALTRNDVAPNVAFVVFRPTEEIAEGVQREGTILMYGKFTSDAIYEPDDNRRWIAMAELQGKDEEVELSLQELGITPDSDCQEWANAVTIAKDEE